MHFHWTRIIWDLLDIGCLLWVVPRLWPEDKHTRWIIYLITFGGGGITDLDKWWSYVHHNNIPAAMYHLAWFGVELWVVLYWFAHHHEWDNERS